MGRPLVWGNPIDCAVDQNNIVNMKTAVCDLTKIRLVRRYVLLILYEMEKG